MSTSKLLGPPQINVTPISVPDNDDKINKNKPSSDPYSASYTPSYSLDSPTHGYTETDSKTYLNTGNPCLDFFYHVVPDTPKSDLTRLLQLSWEKDALLTLKLVCNLRGVRGTGKSDKEGFYVAALWLHENHPKTLACNMRIVSSFGYFKDMPEILSRVLVGSDVREVSKRSRDESLMSRGGRMSSYYGRGRGCRGLALVRDFSSDEDEDEDDEYEYFSKIDKKKNEKTSEEIGTDRVRKEKARVLRLNRKNERTKKLIERYNNDTNFRCLHDSISDHFSELLRKDIDLLNKGEKYKIGFGAKWCPTIDSTYDEVTLLCESIARRVFPKDDFEEYKDMEEAHYAYRVRNRLRKEILVPLRRALELPEVYMCANLWRRLPYNRVPSVAMKGYKTLFYKHDEKRFEEYLEKVKAGKATIAAGALLPHEIIGQLRDPEGAQVAELQWKRMVDDLGKKGKLNNCMAICDVSGSMNGVPMEVCVSLGLLISELSEAPWKGKLITFSEDPQFHTIKGETLKEKTDFIRRMDWGGSTAFQKVFDRILAVAVKGKVPEEQMIKRLFVFSDMEFNEASGDYNYCDYSSDSSESSDGSENKGNKWETDYEIVRGKFKAAGYKNVPEIVFWNLRHSRATPVPSDQPGVALVSGFSKNLLTIFLEGGGIVDPEAVMLEAISKPEYDALVVYD